MDETLRLQCRSLLAAAGLDFYVNVHEGDCRRRDAWDAARLAERLWLDLAQLFLHLAREAADGVVVEPVRDAALLGFFKAIDGALLLVEIASVFDLRFDRF